MNIYDYTLPKPDGSAMHLKDYEGRVLIIVNTASKCGFTAQYEGLEALYRRYKDKGLTIIAVPSNQFGEEEPGSDEEIKQFCTLNYGVTFPVAAKSDVRGPQALPLFNRLTADLPFQGFNPSDRTELLETYLRDNHPDYFDDDSIKWNFTKFVIDRKGHPVARFEPVDAPETMGDLIESLL